MKKRMLKSCALAAALSGLVPGAVGTVSAQSVFFEGFEGITLGPNQDEALAGVKVWSKNGPAGWVADDTGVPGVGDPALDGVTEWAGWSFADKSWWVRAAGDQRRSEFNFGQGTVMIADPDEWDDAAHKQGLLNAYVTTPTFKLTSVTANSLVIAFDSSWRPEAFDDGLPSFPVAEDGSRTNNQTGVILVSYNGGAFQEALRFDSDPESPTYHKDGDFINEAHVLTLPNPGNVTSMALKFGILHSANDWWWAVDNIAVGVPPLLTGVTADGVSFTIKITEALGKTVDTTKPVTVELDGKVVTGATVSKENDRVMVAYSQAPEVFVPGSMHTVKVKFTSNEGKQIEDSGSFKAPSYSVVSSTPTVVTAVITEQEWLKIDESKGIQLKLDGAAVTGATVTRAETNLTVRFTTAVLPSGSAHKLDITFTTTTGKQLTDSQDFLAPKFAEIPTALATAVGTGREAGMKWKTHQLPAARPANNAATVIRQLAGELGASEHDASSQSAGGFFPISVVNFEQAGGEAGFFKASAEPAAIAIADEFIPGIPGINGSTDNIAAESIAYLEFSQPGVYAMGVDVDDGHQLSMGNAADPGFLVLSAGGSTTTYFRISQPGVYLFRMNYWENGGNARAEWFTINNDGTRALVGGTQTGAVKAFRTRSVAEPSIPTPVVSQTQYFEGFESIVLGPNVDEALAGAKVWSKTGPAGWVADDTGVPGVGNPALDGVTEWAGWSFADKNWWVRTAGDQRRSEFAFGQGTVMIADPDEWDDAAHAQGLLNSYVTTPGFKITSVPANGMVVAFDSSWRPEAFDDGTPSFPVAEDGSRTNNQTGVILVSYNGGPFQEALRFDSDPESPTYHKDGDFINEAHMLALSNPAGVTNMSLRFGILHSANDWWWAVDNIAVGTPPLVTGISATGVGFTIRISEALGKTVDITKPVTVELDGKVVTGATVTREEERVMVAYSQAPEIFTPGSVHSVKVKFTTGEGKQAEDNGTFRAPSYTVPSSTPTVVSAVITEQEWLKIDESKGIQVKIDGVAATGVTVVRTDATLNIRFVSASVLASGSAHKLEVTFTTTTGKQITDSQDFVAPKFAEIPAALATAVGTGREAGMKWKTHQLPAARPANNAATVIRQLAGELGASEHDASSQSAGGFFPISVVNFEQAGGEAGFFKASAEPAAIAIADEFIPGIPGINGSTDNIAAESIAYLEFTQAGVYAMGVDVDDGHQLSMGNAADPGFLVLSAGGSTTTYFRISQPGVYLFRMNYWENGGNARAEWFTINNDGTRALVGGTQTGAVKAFRTRSVAEPALPSAGTNNISSVALQNGRVVIQYTGTLQSASEITGPFTPVSGATSPFSVSPSDARRFYIAK